MKGASVRTRTVGSAGAATLSVALLATALAGCGGHHRAAVPPPTTQPPTTIATTTTTTAPPPPPVMPLTGLRPTNAAQLKAPAVVVKIDNIDAARPQTGLNQADVVYEELVEGGLTRLAAVYQSNYPATVGPVRSGRLTDAGIADDLNHPVLAYSGTNPNFLPILRAQPVTDIDGENAPDQFWRADFAAAPHNLYTSVASVARRSTTHLPPKPLWAFRSPASPFGGAASTVVGHVAFPFPQATVVWDFNPATHLYQRTQNGTADLDRAGQQLTATNIVVQFVSYIVSGMATGEGGPPAPIPEGIMVGSGQAWYLSAGRLVKGTWSRPSQTTVSAFRTATGAAVQLSPGRTWVELVPVGTTPAAGA